MDEAGESDPFGDGRGPGEKRQSVVESGLVGVVLIGDQVETNLLGMHGEVDGETRRVVVRRNEHAEAKIVSVFEHLLRNRVLVGVIPQVGTR